MPKRETFGQRVAFFRRTRKWSQRQLAERADLSRTFVARIETDVQDPTLSTVRKLAAALEVRMADLIEDTTAWQLSGASADRRSPANAPSR